MAVFERMRDIRKHRRLSQEEVAEWYSLSKQSYGRKENGKEGGFGPAELALFLEKTQIDARYLFGQIDDIEAADMRKPGYAGADERLKRIEQLIESKVPDAKSADPLREALTKHEIRDLLGLIRFWDSTRLEVVLAYCRGMQGQKDLDDSRERAAG